MKKTTFETLRNIIETVKFGDVNFFNADSITVQDIAEFTARHYSGPGKAIHFKIESGRHGKIWDDAFFVFDNEDNFVGTKIDDFFVNSSWWEK